MVKIAKDLQQSPYLTFPIVSIIVELLGIVVRNVGGKGQ